MIVLHLPLKVIFDNFKAGSESGQKTKRVLVVGGRQNRRPQRRKGKGGAIRKRGYLSSALTTSALVACSASALSNIAVQCLSSFLPKQYPWDFYSEERIFEYVAHFTTSLQSSIVLYW